MADVFCKLVPCNVSAEEAPQLAEKVLAYLVERRILKPYESDDSSFAPGSNYAKIIQKDPAPGLPFVANNEVEVIRGRNVFWTSHADSVRCPHCSHDMSKSKWQKAIDEWYRETGRDALTCTNCGQSSSIADYDFEPTWAFGHLGFCFWNWPPLRADFLHQLESLMGHPLRVVEGKL